MNFAMSSGVAAWPRASVAGSPGTNRVIMVTAKLIRMSTGTMSRRRRMM